MYLICLTTDTDNILIHRIFSWHLLSFQLFIKLAYVMHFLCQKKQKVILGMRILSVTCICCLSKCFWALSFYVGRSMKNTIYDLFSSHFIFCIFSHLSSLLLLQKSQDFKIRNLSHIPPVSHPAKIIFNIIHNNEAFTKCFRSQWNTSTYKWVLHPNLKCMKFWVHTQSLFCKIK